jgi:hypothetical protein
MTDLKGVDIEVSGIGGGFPNPISTLKGLDIIANGTSLGASNGYGIYIKSWGAWTSYSIYVEAGTFRMGASGIVVGNPTGGDKGTGTINVQTDIWKGLYAYTNPDYVFEQAFTGRIEKYKDNPGAKDYTPRSLGETEAYAKEHWHLPGIGKEACGVFAMSDIALEKIEELYLHLFEKDREIRDLKTRIDRLERLGRAAH